MRGPSTPGRRTTRAAGEKRKRAMPHAQRGGYWARHRTRVCVYLHNRDSMLAIIDSRFCDRIIPGARVLKRLCSKENEKAAGGRPVRFRSAGERVMSRYRSFLSG